MKFCQTSIIPPLIYRYESLDVIAKQASFYLAIKLIERYADPKRLIDYHLDDNTFVGFQLLEIQKNE